MIMNGFVKKMDNKKKSNFKKLYNELNKKMNSHETVKINETETQIKGIVGDSKSEEISLVIKPEKEKDIVGILKRLQGQELESTIRTRIIKSQIEQMGQVLSHVQQDIEEVRTEIKEQLLDFLNINPDDVCVELPPLNTYASGRNITIHTNGKVPVDEEKLRQFFPNYKISTEYTDYKTERCTKPIYSEIVIYLETGEESEV